MRVESFHLAVVCSLLRPGCGIPILKASNEVTSYTQEDGAVGTL